MRIFFDLSFLHRTTTKIYINKFFEKRDCKDLCKNICFKVSNMRHIAFGLLKEYEKIFILKEQIKSRMDYYRMALSWTPLVCVLKECRDKNDIWPYRLILAVSQTVWNNSLCFDIVFYFILFSLYFIYFICCIQTGEKQYYNLHTQGGIQEPNIIYILSWLEGNNIKNWSYLIAMNSNLKVQK